MAIEQMVLDGGRLQIGWLLTGCPEPVFPAPLKAKGRKPPTFQQAVKGGLGRLLPRLCQGPGLHGVPAQERPRDDQDAGLSFGPRRAGAQPQGKVEESPSKACRTDPGKLRRLLSRALHECGRGDRSEIGNPQLCKADTMPAPEVRSSRVFSLIVGLRMFLPIGFGVFWRLHHAHPCAGRPLSSSP